MRAWVVVAFALCACDSVFGLHDPRLIDAAYFDAHTDAPFSCPPIGTIPQFSDDFHQAVLASCDNYTVSTTAGRVLAEQLQTNVIEEGEIDSALSPAAGFQSSNFIYDEPRLGPDGDVAIVSAYDNTTTLKKFSEFRRTGDVWAPISDLSADFAIFAATSPTRGSPARVMVTYGNNVEEIMEDGAGGWTVVAMYAGTDLGVTLIVAMNLSADGLRLLIEGSSPTVDEGLFYTDRNDVTERFSVATVLPNVGFVPNGFMTEDCSRLYFTALDTVFFAQRL